MKRFMVLVLAFVCLLGYNSFIALAQEEQLEYSWGTVVNVSSGQIVVSEYDYDKDEEINVTYSVDPKVVLKNIDSIDSISVGDSIEIDYLVKGDKKIAKIIAVEKFSYQEEQEPLEIYEDLPEGSPEDIEF